jgi:hypothetical protein
MAGKEVQDSMTQAAAPTQPMGSELDLEAVESAVLELLLCYRIALQFASDMPMLGRSAISSEPPKRSDWWRSRWGSRFFTKVYVETHVRKQLRAIGACLRLELLGSAPGLDRTERIAALEKSLDGAAAPLFRWRRPVALVTRLPPIAAALPIIATAVVRPFAEGVSVHTVLWTFLWLAAIALVLWIFVVWPSIRLGFRVKRAIFAGGSDLRHLYWDKPDEIRWRGFRRPRFYDDRERRGDREQPFPPINVYGRENDVFRALGRRKPAEVPLDLLFALTPYLRLVGAALFLYAVIDKVVRDPSLPASSWVVLGFLSFVAVAVIVLSPQQGTKNYRRRRH